MVAVIGLGLLALLKLGSEFHRLLLDPGPNGAVDLVFRHEETRLWFAGVPIYQTLDRITYPPAAYLCFWPLLGWVGLPGARVLWALTAAGMLALLVGLMLQASGAVNRPERILVGLIVLSMNAVGVAIGNGQLVLHLLPPLLGALLLLRGEASLSREIGAAGLVLIALAKPTISLPFLWVALAVARRIRPFALIIALYLIATLVSSTFQSANPVELAVAWIRQSGRYLEGGYGDLQTALLSLNLAGWANPGALAAFLIAGIWIWIHRDADFWILVGMAALVARLWTYHRNYDDTVVVLAIIALFRAARGGSTGTKPDRLAGILCVMAVVAMLAPARLEFGVPPLDSLYVWGHALAWITMLIYLGRKAAVAG